MHQILISPLITEKMTNITADKGKYGFLVNPKANKIQIA
jgi:ribosomal protein L23